jgi:hypothetical protein
MSVGFPSRFVSSRWWPAESQSKKVLSSYPKLRMSLGVSGPIGEGIRFLGFQAIGIRNRSLIDRVAA